MKKLLILACFILSFLTVSSMSAQTIVSQGFDLSSGLPAGWTQANVVGSSTLYWRCVTSPTYPDHAVRTGSGCLEWYAWLVNNNNEQALFTPSFSLSQRPAGASATVSFWMWRSNTDDGTTALKVFINTSASMTGATILNFNTAADTSIGFRIGMAPIVSTEGWYQYTFNIPASFNGTTNYLIFKGSNSDYTNDIHIDDMTYTTYPNNMVYTSSTTYNASQENVPKGSTNNPIIAYQAVTSGGANPLNVTSLTFNTTGTSNVSDITNAKVYYTNTSTFSTATQFGTAVANPNGTFTVTGSQALQEGSNNYFWLCYDLSSSSAAGDIVDAQCTSAIIGGTSRTPTVTAPDGNRIIFTQLFKEGFEYASGLPTGWKQVNVVGTSSLLWYCAATGQCPNGTLPHNGTGFMQWYANNVSANNVQDLVSSAINLSARPAGSPLNLTVWVYRHNYSNHSPATRFQIYMNTVDTVANATLLSLASDNTVNTIGTYYAEAPAVSSTALGWYKYTFSVPAQFNGSTNYIIINGISDYYNSIQMDDLSLDVPPPMVYSSGNAVNVTNDPATIGQTNAAIIAAQINVVGSLNPLSVSQIKFNTTGCTSATNDIQTAKVYYTGTSTTFNPSTATLFGTLSNPSGLMTFSGSQALVEGSNYFWVVYDIKSTATPDDYIDAQFVSATVGGVERIPTNGNPDGNRQLELALGGDYYIGTYSNAPANRIYPNFTSFLHDLNLIGAQSNITANITSDITEPGTDELDINPWLEIGTGGYTLTIRPTGNTPRTIYANKPGTGILNLIAVHNVTIDGRNDGTGSTNNLSFVNTSTSGGASLLLWSLGTGNGCNNVMLRNLNLYMPSTIYSTTNSYFGIFINNDDNDNVKIYNNNFKLCNTGIYQATSTANGLDDGLEIKNNIIGNSDYNQRIGNYGIVISNANAPQIVNNQIFNIGSTDVNNYIVSYATGINVGNNVSNALIDRNNIYNINNMYSGVYGAFGINFGGSTNVNNNAVTNNQISGLNAYGSSSLAYSPYGIRITGGTNYKIYHNTVKMSGTMPNTSAAYSASLLFSSAVTGSDVRNNIFINSMTGASGSKCYAINYPTGMTFSNIDYNDYYVTGTNGVLAYNGSDVTALSALVTSNTNQHSISQNVIFLGTNNFHLNDTSAVSQSLLAAPISTVSADMDGYARRANYVQIGCDEVKPILGFATNNDLSRFNNMALCVPATLAMSVQPIISGYEDGIARTVNNPTFTYAWSAGGTAISNNTNTYTYNITSENRNGIIISVAPSLLYSTTNSQASIVSEQAIQITQNPAAVTKICSDVGSIVATFDATGTIDYYRWQKLDAKTNKWNDLPNSNTKALTIDVNTLGPGYYRAYAAGPGVCDSAIKHTEVTQVIMTDPVSNPTISIDANHPNPENICLGDDIVLSAAAKGEIIGFQWQKQINGNWINLDNKLYPTSLMPSLTIPSATADETGYYRCIISGNTICATTSVNTDPMHIQIFAPFQIVKNPDEQIICRGQNAQMMVQTDGIVLRYLWKKDGVALDSVANPTAAQPILEVDNCNFDQSGAYSCAMYVNDCSGIHWVESQPALLYVTTDTRITKAPETQYVKEGNKATFTVEARVVGAPPSYKPEIQWYKGNTQLQDNNHISGTNSNILVIDDIQAADFGDDYYVKVTGNCSSAQSDNFGIKLSTINLTKQPQDVNACEGSDAVYSVEATPGNQGETLSYEWHHVTINNTDMIMPSDKNDPAKLVINDVKSSDSGYVYARITVTPGGAVTITNHAALNILIPAAILYNPAPTTTVKANDQFALAVVAQGSNLQYQWYRNGSTINGATTDTYAGTEPASGTFNYYCVVSNDCTPDGVKSQTAEVTVTANVQDPTAVDNELQNGYGLLPNTPNPFDNSTTITYVTPRATNVRLSVIDVTGREIAVLVNGYVSEGSHPITFEAGTYNLSSGVYYISFSADNFMQTRKMVICR